MRLIYIYIKLKINCCLYDNVLLWMRSLLGQCWNIAVHVNMSMSMAGRSRVQRKLYSYIMKKVNPLLTQWHWSQCIIYHSQGPTRSRATELWPTEMSPWQNAEDTNISLRRKQTLGLLIKCLSNTCCEVKILAQPKNHIKRKRESGAISR